ncbi:hypothetical protein LTR37_016694 [Vermiconidia calcicola]|uniref:Uncharacterized protein n=1 Tax=Vermiconidia calcicola TaxID=1690605 RepID=A0ACC3MND3_9PEZI|nr:hypothetical protein LTR37_016694 [Vermiconidia calcicola]
MDSGLQVREVPDSSQPQYYDPGADVQKEVLHGSYPYHLPNESNEGKVDAVNKLHRRDMICRLGPLTFGLLVAFLTAVVVGASVGGGLGSALAKDGQHGSLSMATTTVTKTIQAGSQASSLTNPEGQLEDYVVEPASNISSVALECSGLGAAPTLG